MTVILSGAEVASAMNSVISTKAKRLRDSGMVPSLTIVRVGGREDAIAYEQGAIRRCEGVGISVKSLVFDEAIGEGALTEAIDELNDADDVHGVLILRPLPAHLNDARIRNRLSPYKDIDGITDVSIASVFTGVENGFCPCTPQACLEILDHYQISLAGKNVVILGRSLVIGRPVAMMLLARHATVTICHSQTKDLAAALRSADIVVSCMGKAKMIGEKYLHEGQVVIDVGINFTRDKKLVGDVDYDAVVSKLAAITPVPGGVGTVTTSVLAKHVVEAAMWRANMNIQLGR